MLFCAEFATIGLVGSGLTPHEPCGIRKQVQGLCGTTAVNGTAAASRETRSAAAKQRSTTSAAGRRSHWGASPEKAPRRLREPEDGPPSEAAVYPAGIFAASLPRRTIYHKEKDTMKQHFSRSLICLILVLLLAAAGLQGCAPRPRRPPLRRPPPQRPRPLRSLPSPPLLQRKRPPSWARAPRASPLKSLTLTARRSITPCTPTPRRSARRSSRSV